MSIEEPVLDESSGSDSVYKQAEYRCLWDNEFMNACMASGSPVAESVALGPVESPIIRL